MSKLKIEEYYDWFCDSCNRQGFNCLTSFGNTNKGETYCGKCNKKVSITRKLYDRKVPVDVLIKRLTGILHIATEKRPNSNQMDKCLIEDFILELEEEDETKH